MNDRNATDEIEIALELNTESLLQVTEDIGGKTPQRGLRSLFKVNIDENRYITTLCRWIIGTLVIFMWGFQGQILTPVQTTLQPASK